MHSERRIEGRPKKLYSREKEQECPRNERVRMETIACDRTVYKMKK